MIPITPVIASSIAAAAEVAAAALTSPARASTASPAGASFGQVLEQVVSGAVETLKSGEAAAIGGVLGNVPVQKVVDSVLAAERELQMVIAIRDKAVNAYQEISRMAI